MNSGCIAFLDSGVGGLPYLKEVKSLRPDLSYIYYADGGNFPYGVKESTELVELLLSRTQLLLQNYNPHLIVVACNTASVTALDVLRKNFSVPFVGVVPAVKPAAEQSRNKKIGILATEGTVKGPYMDWLEQSFASDCTVYREAAGDIVDLVENRFFDSSSEDKKNLITRAVQKLLIENVDTIVLGCTHFIYVQKEINELVSSKVRVIDSRQGVAQQVLRMITKYGIRNYSNPESFLVHSGTMKEEIRYRQFSELFRLKYEGILQ